MVEVRRRGRTADSYTTSGCFFNNTYGLSSSRQLFINGDIPVTKGSTRVTFVFDEADMEQLAREMMRASPIAATKAFATALLERDISDE